MTSIRLQDILDEIEAAAVAGAPLPAELTAELRQMVPCATRSRTERTVYDDPDGGTRHYPAEDVTITVHRYALGDGDAVYTSDGYTGEFPPDGEAGLEQPLDERDGEELWRSALVDVQVDSLAAGEEHIDFDFPKISPYLGDDEQTAIQEEKWALIDSVAAAYRTWWERRGFSVWDTREWEQASERAANPAVDWYDPTRDEEDDAMNAAWAAVPADVEPRLVALRARIIAANAAAEAITPADLAAELDVPLSAVESVVDQLVSVAGRAATYADAADGTDELLTASTAAAVRGLLPATERTSGSWERVEEALTDAASAFDEATGRLEEARAARDTAIRAARADGWAVTDIARTVGVTRGAVYDALDRS